MANGTGLVGPWKGAVDRVAGFPKDLRIRLQRATLRNCVFLAGKIKEGILSQRPGGLAWKPLHPFTISQRLAGLSKGARAKAEKRGAEITAQGGTAHKALVHHGDLLASITYKVNADGLSGRVGVLRQARTRDGQEMVNVARILSEGRVIRVTPKMRAWMHRQGFHLKPSTTQIVIPPRPFLAPVYYQFRPVLVENYRAALRGSV